MTLNPRMFMGLDDDGLMAWRATKPGFNVLSETDQENFSFNSDWARTGLIHETGTTTGGTVYFEELPFVPHVLVFRLDDPDIYMSEQVSSYNSSTGSSGPQTAYYPIFIAVDSFYCFPPLGGPTPAVYPYIVFKVPVIGAT